MLVDRARERKASKRGGDAERVAFEEALNVGVPPDVEMIALNSALSDLESFDPQKARVVELRYSRASPFRKLPK